MFSVACVEMWNSFIITNKWIGTNFYKMLHTGHKTSPMTHALTDVTKSAREGGRRRGRESGPQSVHFISQMPGLLKVLFLGSRYATHPAFAPGTLGLA